MKESLNKAWRFCLFVIRRYGEDRCPQHAAALAYTTLLSLVPLMAVTFGVIAAFPVFESFSADLQSFVFSNFVPTAGEVLQEYLGGFAAKASKLTAVGIGVLLVTAILMMATIDKAFNMIWHTRAGRGPIASFMVYWAVLSLGPMFMGASLAVSSYLVSLPFLNDAAESIGGVQSLLRLMPFLMAVSAFTLIYLVVPNRRVKLRHALLGGVLAGVLFELAKRLFAYYVTTFPTYEAIYGTLATVPIFLIWIYVSWMIALLGAEFTRCLAIYRDSGSELSHPEAVRFIIAIRLLGRLWQAQSRGEAMRSAALIDQEPAYTVEEVEDVLSALMKARLVHQAGGGAWALSRDPAEVSLGDVYHSDGFVLPCEKALQTQDVWDERLSAMLVEVHRDINRAMQMPIKAFYSADEK